MGGGGEGENFGERDYWKVDCQLTVNERGGKGGGVVRILQSHMRGSGNFLEK